MVENDDSLRNFLPFVNLVSYGKKQFLITASKQIRPRTIHRGIWRFGLYAAGARSILDPKDFNSSKIKDTESTIIRTDIVLQYYNNFPMSEETKKITLEEG